MTKEFLDFAIATAEKAGKKLMEHFKESPPITRGTPKEVKSVFDEVADKIIIEEIQKHYSNHSILTEETGFIDKKSVFVWYIDPLDGTGNYVNSNPFWSISMSLWHQGEPLVGVIEAPALGERYIAEIDKGAHLIDLKNGKRQKLKVSETDSLNSAYLTFCEGGVEDRQRVVETIKKLYPQVKDMRKLGSAALEMAWVAAGRADAYITHDISPWDIAAGVLLVHEAGGNLLHFNGEEFFLSDIPNYENLDIIAINNNLKLKPIN